MPRCVTLWSVHAEALERVASGDLTHGAEDSRTASALRSLLRKGFVAREIRPPEGVVWSVTPAGRERLAVRREALERVAGRWGMAPVGG